MEEELIRALRDDVTADVDRLGDAIRQVAFAQLHIALALTHHLLRNGALERNDVDAMAQLLENRASREWDSETAPDRSVLREYARMLRRDLPRRETPATDRNGA